MNCIRLTAVLLLAAISASPATAAEATSGIVDNIVVTANREPTPIREVGSSFSIVERSTIVERQSIFGAELLQDLPGVAVSRTGTFGSQTQVRIRGAEANQVLVMIDGIKVNDLTAGDEFNFANLTTFDVERIEVVRGPQSALWGSDSMAGVINIITRKADRPLDAEVFVEGGAFDTLSAGGRIGTAREHGNVNLSTSYVETEGANISRLGDEKDGYDNWTTTFNAAYDPAQNFRLDLVARHTDASNDFDNSDFGPPVDALNWTEQQQSYFQARGQLALFERFWDQELRMTWVDTENRTSVDEAWDRTESGEKLGLYYQSNLNLTRNAEGEATSTLILALDYEEEDYRQRGEAKPWGDPNRDESMDITGLVAEYLAKPLIDWALSLSVRHDDNSNFDDVTTWRATTSYRIAASATRLRASAGTGQKRPTFTERFGFFTNFIGNPNLKPETSRGWDVGVDQGFLAERLIVNLTYFNEKLENEIDSFFFDVGSGGYTAVNMDGTSARKGIEAALAAGITAALDLTASYTYTDATEQDDAGNDVREIRRPQHMAAANLNYRFVRDRANVNLNVSYSGDQLDDDFSTFPATRRTLGAYTLVNLTTEFAATDNLTIYGRVENLLDKDYESAYGFASPGIGGFVGARLSFTN